MSDRFTLALAGDVMLGRGMNDRLAREGPEAPWEAARHLWEDADAFLFNLECAICGDLPPWEPERKAFHFRMDPAHLATLRASGVDAVALANNHVLDFDVAGLEETLRHLDALTLPHAGAGTDLHAAQAPALLDRRSGRLGLVAAADHERAWGAGPDSPGIHLVDPHERASLDVAADAIERARREGADFLVFALHWGPNMRRAPPAEFQWFARNLLELGVDVVWGTSAHLTQGIEFHGEGVILYDTGDFLDDYAVDPYARNDLGFLYRLELGEGRPRVRLHPVRIEAGRVRPATPVEADWVATVERELCATLGTRLDAVDEAFEATPVPPPRGIEVV